MLVPLLSQLLSLEYAWENSWLSSAMSIVSSVTVSMVCRACSIEFDRPRCRLFGIFAVHPLALPTCVYIYVGGVEGRDRLVGRVEYGRVEEKEGIVHMG